MDMRRQWGKFMCLCPTNVMSIVFSIVYCYLNRISTCSSRSELTEAMFCRTCSARLCYRFINASAAARLYRSKAGVYGYRPEIQTSFDEGKNQALAAFCVQVATSQVYSFKQSSARLNGGLEGYIPPLPRSGHELYPLKK